MAGSLGRFLCPSALALSSRDEVPAGVRGGECMADAGDDGIEERCPECAEAVREAGDGEGALWLLALCSNCGVVYEACLLVKAAVRQARRKSSPYALPAFVISGE